jgi:hypothetical protein
MGAGQHGQVTDPRTRVADLGAWLLKSDPGGWSARLDDPAPAQLWCVRPTYRSRSMAAGDRVLLWVSGDGRRFTPGLWGAGRVTGPVTAGRVPVTVTRFPRVRVGRAELLAEPRLAALEVLRQPFGSNPSYVTRGELAVLAELAGPLPFAP